MKERPILMSAPMVRAILEGKKTQTRRALRQQPQPLDSAHHQDGDGNWIFGYPNAPDLADFTRKKYPAGSNQGIKCPYGRPGDLLWVRETWCRNPSHGSSTFGGGCGSRSSDIDFLYRADSADWEGVKWKSSIFMPRAACRLRLKVARVRVERLRNITPADAIAEGVFQLSGGYWAGGIHKVKGTYKHLPDPVSAYRDLFESINGDGSWTANPWVWVIDFRIMEPA